MRSSGILMHITSLPGPYGIGTMGREAYRFVDFLQAAGQSYWQILPLTPTGFGDSPYQSCSTFAGNPYLIDLDALAEEGLLKREALASHDWGAQPERVDFGRLYIHRWQVLREAYAAFPGSEEFDCFCRRASSWLPDFALFMALKKEYGGAWYTWPEALKRREPDAVWHARQSLRDEIRFQSFVQFAFFHQWEALRGYAHRSGVRIIGDVPIYVPYDSVEVWASPELFRLDAQLAPEAVAGCPPYAVTDDGQLWGNPLYRWDTLRKDGYGWWIRRLAAAGELYDVVRFDHFRGFESFWAVPYGDETARGGAWEPGPGLEFIRAVQRALPGLKLIAEDLGYLTPEVLRLRDESGLPGMKVLEFAFDSREPSDYLPHNYTRNSVCYTGTHDNMTMRQWFDTASPDAAAYAREYLALTEQEGLVWGCIRSAMASVSDLAVIQMQDYLDLGGEARMNFPGTTGSNWGWRAADGYLDASLARRIRSLTTLYGRLGDQAEKKEINTHE